MENLDEIRALMFQALRRKGLVPETREVFYDIKTLWEISQFSWHKKFLIRMKNKRTIHNILHRLHYWRDKYYLYKVKHCTPILIYQMGWCGSMSIFQAIKSSGYEPVYHMHTLNLDHPNLSWRDRKISKDFLGKRKVKIITMVRDPIKRNISHFWYCLPAYGGRPENSIENLTELFLKKEKHITPLIWFIEELRYMTGINVYSYPWNEEQNYIRINKDNFEVLILKTETSNQIKEKILKDFLGFEVKIESNRNVKYDPNFVKFSSEIKLPLSYLEDMKNSNYYQHFYKGKQEI